MERFLDSAIPVYAMTVITAIGVIVTWAAGIYYRQMIKQTDNMMSVRYTFLQQIKNRFENTYRMNKGIKDIPLFVEKQLRGNKIFGFCTEKLGKASQKAGILCLLIGGSVAVLQRLHDFSSGRTATTLGITILYSAVCFCAYYLFDLKENQEWLKIQLTEYFTNNLEKRLIRAAEEEVSGRRGSSKAETGKRNTADSSELFFSNSPDIRENSDRRDGKTSNRRDEKHIERSGIDGIDSEETHFTEEDLRYLRQSLERIAAGRDDSFDTGKKHHFSSKEEKIIDDILKEYF